MPNLAHLMYMCRLVHILNMYMHIHCCPNLMISVLLRVSNSLKLLKIFKIYIYIYTCIRNDVCCFVNIFIHVYIYMYIQVNL